MLCFMVWIPLCKIRAKCLQNSLFWLVIMTILASY